MRYLLITAKWLFAIIMVLCLLFGVSFLIAYNISKEYFPTSRDELEIEKVTVISDFINDSKETLFTREYPHSELIIGKVSSGLLPIKGGEKIEIYVRKIDTPNLKAGKPTAVWGVNSADGKQLLDPHFVVSLSAKHIGEKIHTAAHILIAVPILYFITLIILFVRRRKKNRINPAKLSG